MTLRRAAAEALGTFFLVFVGTGAILADEVTDGAVGAVGIALAFGLTVMAMIYATGHVSGAHLNPAVTLGFWATRRFPGRTVPVYVVAQLLGAVAASALLAVLRVASDLQGSLGATVPAVPLGPALVVELVLSFALMFVIMAVATDARAPRGFAGAAIGSVVVFAALMGGPLSGASMNPARSLGPALVEGLWTEQWIYVVGPVTGAVLAALGYEWIRDADAHDLAVKGVYGVEGPLAPADREGAAGD